MIKKLTEAIQDHKSIVKNFSYLSLLQVINMFVPLVTYPYLIRVLGDDVYGLVIYAQAIIQYFLIIVTFGFNITGTKHISANRHNKSKLSEIVSSIFVIKGVLFFFVSLILLILILIIPSFSENKLLYILMLWMCLYDVLFPVWYFQGIEKMNYVTLITGLSKMFFLSMIFIFVKSKEDFLLVPIINGTGSVLAALISLFIIFKRHRLHFVIKEFNVIKLYFIDSMPIFLSNVVSRLYTSSNKVIIGSLTGMSEVAMYDLAEKLINLLKMPQQMLITATFPKVVAEKSIKLSKQICHFSLLVNSLLFGLVLLFGKVVVMIIGGEAMLSAVDVLYVLALILPSYAIANSLGPLGLLGFGANNDFSKVTIAAAGFYFVLMASLLSTVEISVFIICVVTVIAVALEAFGMFYYSRRNWRINKIKWE